MYGHQKYGMMQLMYFLMYFVVSLHSFDIMKYVGRHKVFFDVMTYFWRNDLIVDVMNYLWNHELLFDIVTYLVYNIRFDGFTYFS